METPRPPFDRYDLDEACRTCDKHGEKIPREAGAYLHSKCHPHVPFVSARYYPDTGVLSLTCAMCDRKVIDVAVSAGSGPEEDY